MAQLHAMRGITLLREESVERVSAAGLGHLMGVTGPALARHGGVSRESREDQHHRRYDRQAPSARFMLVIDHFLVCCRDRRPSASFSQATVVSQPRRSNLWRER